MNDKSKPKRGARPPPAREDRLKAALKANLARRKAQARVRAQTDDHAPDTTGQEKDG